MFELCHLLSVEPTMFLYMFAFMLTGVVEQAFYIHRACTVDHGFSQERCSNISSDSEMNSIVQPTVSVFHQWNGIAGHLMPIILAIFMGAYSDKRGRKTIILMGLIGKLYFSLMLVAISITDWPLMYTMYAATIPCSFTGSDLAIFTGCFAYIVDITSPVSRSLRIRVLDISYMITILLGPALGRLIWVHLADGSYTLMFSINSALMFIAILYSVWNLKHKTGDGPHVTLRKSNPIKEFFDWSNVKDTVNTVTRRRFEGDRYKLWMVIAARAFYVVQREEKSVLYLHLTRYLQWDFNAFSRFMTFNRVMYATSLLFALPLLTKLFNWRDSCIGMIGTLSFIAGHLMYANATSAKLMYAGAGLGALGPCVSPILRTITTKLVEINEIGSVCALLAAVENLVDMISSVMYAQYYKATMNTVCASTFFYITILSQSIVFYLLLFMDMKAIKKWIFRSRGTYKVEAHEVVLTFISNNNYETSV